MKGTVLPEDAKRRRIVIVSGTSLAWNPRVQKEAATLTRADFEVVVLGGGAGGLRLFQDLEIARRGGYVFQPVDLNDCSTPFGVLCSAGNKVRSRAVATWHRATGMESRFQLGPLVNRLWKAVQSLRADLYLIHLEQAMWVGERLMESGRKIGVDMEDWYSEDLLPEARKSRPLKILRELEERLLRGSAHRTCPTQAMASALSAEFRCPSPEVLYNAFPWADRSALDGQMKDRRDLTVPSIHWFSQTLGPGRGLDDLFAALPLLRCPVELHLRGALASGFEQWMISCIPPTFRKRVFVHDVVSNDQLLSRISEHDIGFAGEMKYCRSKELTASNKILHSLLAGLAVVASDTAGQVEVARMAPGAISVFGSGRPGELAAELNRLLASTDTLGAAKRAALAAARSTFCWERQEPIFLASIERALA